MPAWLRRLWPWRRRVYLGYVILKYHAPGKPDVINETMCVHFWSDAHDLGKRRRVTFGSGSEFGARRHTWFWQNVEPWLNGGNLWAPIHFPSDWLQDYAKRKHGYERVGGKWVKPAPVEHREGNVVTLKVGK